MGYPDCGEKCKTDKEDRVCKCDIDKDDDIKIEQIFWPGGQIGVVPLSTPKCGYSNEFCPQKGICRHL